MSSAEVAVRQSPTTPTREWNVIVAQAEMLAQSDIVPTSFRRKAPNIIAAAIAGRAYGWDAMTAMLNGHVIEGKYGVSPEAQLGLVREQGHSVAKIAEERGVSVTVRGTRADSGDTLDVTWTIQDAKTAGLANKSNWKNYPAAMLWARAVSELCTQLFSDVTLGLARYTDEELGADDDVDSDAAALPERAKPPDGWKSWDECDAAHDAYLQRWREAPKDARVKMTGYTKSSGYSRPMTKLELDDLEGQLDIELGAPAERQQPAPAVEADHIDEAELVDESPDQPNGAQTLAAPEVAAPVAGGDGLDVPDVTPEPVPAPSEAPDDDGPPPVESGTAAPVPGPASGDGAAPSAEPSTPGEKGRLAQIVKQLWTDNNAAATVRHALVDVVSQGRTKSSVELTGPEIRYAIKAAKLLVAGALGLGVAQSPTDDFRLLEGLELPGEDDYVTLIACITESGDADQGVAFLEELAAFLDLVPAPA